MSASFISRTPKITGPCGFPSKPHQRVLSTISVEGFFDQVLCQAAFSFARLREAMSSLDAPTNATGTSCKPRQFHRLGCGDASFVLPCGWHSWRKRDVARQSQRSPVVLAGATTRFKSYHPEAEEAEVARSCPWDFAQKWGFEGMSEVVSLRITCVPLAFVVESNVSRDVALL